MNTLGAGSWNSSRLKNVTSLSFVLRLCFIAGGFLVTLLLTRWLGAEILGIYNYVVSWMILGVVFLKLGFEEFIAREFASNAQLGDQHRSANIWGTALWFVVTPAVAIAACVAVGCIYGAVNTGSETTFALGMAAPLLPLLAFGELIRGRLRGAKLVTQCQLGDAIFRPCTMIIGASCFIFLGFPVKIWHPIALAWVGAMSSLLAGVCFLRKARLPQPKGTSLIPKHWRRFVFGAIPFVVIASMQVINQRTDRVMLGNLVGMESVGLYSVAVQIASVVNLAMVALNLAIGPEIASRSAVGKTLSLQKQILFATSVATGVSITSLFILYLFGDVLLRIFGLEFPAVYSVMLVLAVGQVTNVIAGPTEALMSMTGHEKLVAIVFGSSVVINVVLNAVLIPRYQIMGAAIATSTSIIMKNVVSVIVTRQAVGVAPNYFALLIPRSSGTK